MLIVNLVNYLWASAMRTSPKTIINLSRLLIAAVCDSFERSYLARHPALKINRNQFTTLELISVTGPRLVSEIAEILQISRAAASKNIDGLVKSKLVRRRIIPKDRRNTLIYLTAEGRRLVKDFQSEVTDKHATVANAFSAEELNTLHALLRKFVRVCLEEESNISLICVHCDGMIRENCSVNEDQEVCRYFHKKQKDEERSNVA